VRDFLSSLYRDTILPTVRSGRQVVEDLTTLPDRHRTLERECEALRSDLATKHAELQALHQELTAVAVSLDEHEAETSVLRSLVGDLESNLATAETAAHRATETARLTEARCRLVVALHHLAVARAEARDASTIEALTRSLAELQRDRELLQALHERTMADLTTLERELRRQADTSDEASHRADALAARLLDLDGRYRTLQDEVRHSTHDIVEKLVGRGLSTTAIVDLIPDMGGLFPHETLRSLEREIRRHNDEQEALLGLQKLRYTPPPGTFTGEPSAATWALEPRSFYERIFTD